MTLVPHLFPASAGNWWQNLRSGNFFSGLKANFNTGNMGNMMSGFMSRVQSSGILGALGARGARVQEYLGRGQALLASVGNIASSFRGSGRGGGGGARARA